MTSVVITEKPSQARDVRAAVGNAYGQVLACEGHLLRLAEPEEVNADWKPWGFDVLQPPSFFPWRPDKTGGKTKRLADIKKALASAAEVTIATDCDREGQLIGQSLLEYFGYKGRVFRAIFTAQDAQTLKDAFKARQPNEQFQGLFDAAMARQQSDQTYNLTLTRAATRALRPPGEKGPIGIGRVKTATLALVCRRELEIREFAALPYYEVTARAECASGTLALRHAPGEENRILDRAAAAEIATMAEGFAGPLAVGRTKQTRRPPRLPDLPALQKKCGAWGWAAERTLNVAQTLYEERKLITYPRAEAAWLAENQIADAGTLLKRLAAADAYAGLAPAEPVIRKGKSGHFCDKCLEGLSHHAVIPNVNGLEGLPAALSALTADEKRLFDYIARTFLAAMMPDYEFEATTVTLDVAGHAFTARGAVPLAEGWKAAWARRGQAGGAAGGGEEDGEEDGGGRLPPVKDGEHAGLSGAAVEDKTTRPPPRFHEGGLIEAMQNAWKFVADEALRERLKDAKGIGTPATRGGVIEGLKAQKMLKIKGKHIVPAEPGLELYRVLAEGVPPLVDPGTTARWELRLDEVVLGHASAREVWDEISAEAGRLVGLLREAAGGVATGAARGPTENMLAAANQIAARKGLALPPAAASDFAACRAFLDEHAGRGGGAGAKDGTPSGPSEKQLSFAEKIAREAGIELPGEARTDPKACSAFIDKHARPSEKQLSFAEKIAREAGIELPGEARTDPKACSAFIDAHKQGGKGRRR